MKQIYLLFLALQLILSPLYSQEVTHEDYKRAVSFLHDNHNNKTVFNLKTKINWFKDGTGLWFIDYSKNKKTYKLVDFKNTKVVDLFNHNKMASALTEFSEKLIKENQLSLSNIEKRGKGNLEFKFEDKSYVLNLKSYQLTLQEEKPKEEKNLFEAKSPDGKWIAYTKDYNLFIKSIESSKEFQLSNEGKRGYEYATRYDWYDKMEGENGERPKRFFMNWSEDSNWIATNIIDTRNAEKMYMLDHSIDSLYKPKLLSYYRGSPGDTTMVMVTPVFYNVKTKKEVKTSLPTGTHVNSVSIEGMKQSGELLADYLERGYKKKVLKHINLNNGKEKILIEETNETNIDNFWFRQLQEKLKVIFLSERSGWRQLYMVDLKTNKISAITTGDYYINSVVYTDEDKEEIYFMASGKEPNSNPYYQKLYRVNFEGKVTLLTPGNTHHSINFSKNGKYFADNYSTINIPTRTVLRSSRSGKILTELTTADVSDAQSKGWQSPEIFQLTSKDKKTTIYGALWKPTNFDSTKSYPIIDATYTGPHTQVFPKSFDRGFSNQSLAEFGFIVMNVDGLGTSGRSKEFHDHSYKNMGNNLEDHVLAIKHLGQKYSWINTDKVGVFGHSAGGYDTGRAMLAFPDVYKVGVASSGDHDFRMEKAWWPEMYQGWPVDETYEEVSNITNAENLKGKLLLVHGGIDDNVNPSATFKLAEALVNADKEFDLLIFPSQRHGYVGEARNYFIK
ncbi:MAG: prolyl oligopeptidase family serine peptidase, partial [Flavobacteriaceae bacterium]|nr:prolyl oligopeptidase family serine peptidase [Flavobacteriaceae bacterium]